MTMFNEQFILVKTKANFETLLAAGNIADTSIAFIEDTSEIWAKGKYYPCLNRAFAISILDTLGCFDSTNVEDALKEVKQLVDTHLENDTPGLKHIPDGGLPNLVLSWDSQGTAKWNSINNLTTTEDILAYGVEWDITVADPKLTRIGNMSLHKSLPILSGMYGCICLGTSIQYELDPDDWRFKKNPTTILVNLTIEDTVLKIESDVFSTLLYDKLWIKINDIKILIKNIDTELSIATLVSNDSTDVLQEGVYSCELGSVRNGYDGIVKVYVPGFYIKSVSEGNIRRVWLSTNQIDNTYTYLPAVLVDAYRCTVLNSVPENMGYLSTLSTNTAVSVANTNTYCRGANNTASYDSYLESDPLRTYLGKPRTALSRTTFRPYVTKIGAHLLSYEEYKNIFYWLYVVEYANFNSLASYNALLDANGFRQGGLGAGVTAVGTPTWTGYNKLYPLIPCGYLDNLGNGTGVYSHKVEAFEVEVTSLSTWNSWATSTYRVEGNNVNRATILNKSTSTITITDISLVGNILEASPIIVSGQVTYRISGLLDGLSILFISLTTLTVDLDGDVVIDWGTVGNITRVLKATFTGACSITVSILLTNTTLVQFPSFSISINRWRGFDTPFGDIYTILDGVLVDANHVDMDLVYICKDPSHFGDTLTEYYIKAGESIHSEGYIKAFNLGKSALIFAAAVGAGSTTYMCDYHYVGNANSTLRVLLVGGTAYHSSPAGLGFWVSSSSASAAWSHAGFRSVLVIG